MEERRRERERVSQEVWVSYVMQAHILVFGKMDGESLWSALGWKSSAASVTHTHTHARTLAHIHLQAQAHVRTHSHM